MVPLDSSESLIAPVRSVGCGAKPINEMSEWIMTWYYLGPTFVTDVLLMKVLWGINNKEDVISQCFDKFVWLVLQGVSSNWEAWMTDGRTKISIPN